jgi:hypothetical protein
LAQRQDAGSDQRTLRRADLACRRLLPDMCGYPILRSCSFELFKRRKLANEEDDVNPIRGAAIGLIRFTRRGFALLAPSLRLSL